MRVGQIVINQHPNCVPVIMHRKSENDPPTSTEKLIAPQELSFAKFVSEMRKHIKETRKFSINLYIGDTKNPAPDIPMKTLYELHQNPEDGLLHISYEINLI